MTARDWFHHVFLGMALVSASASAMAQSASLVADIRVLPEPGHAASRASVESLAIDERLYFVLDDGFHGDELWTSDGTSAGTRMVADVCPGACGSRPTQLSATSGRLLFVADDAVHGREWWQSDGTVEGTQPIRDVYPGKANGVWFSPAVAVGDMAFVAAHDREHGVELWRIDPDANQMVLLKDIWPGTASSFPSSLVAVGSALFFTADRGEHHVELWTSDGTTAGTRLVADPNSEFSAPRYLTVVDDSLFFSARFGLFRTDAAASAVERLYPAPPSWLTAVGSRIYFADRAELWTTDATPAGTIRLQDFGSGNWPSALVGVRQRLFFAAGDATHGRELWSSDGTPAGTALVSDLTPGPEGSHLFPLLDPWRGSVHIDGVAFFGQFDAGCDRCFTLWRSEGTEASTFVVEQGYTFLGPKAMVVGGKVIFTGRKDGMGVEPWRSDGTANGTVPLGDLAPGAQSSDPQLLQRLEDRVVFAADDGQHGREVWLSDASFAGTVLLDDVNPGVGASRPRALVDLNGTLFFNADDGESGRELWRSNSADQDTVLFHDFAPGAPSGLGLHSDVETVVNHLFLTSWPDLCPYPCPRRLLRTDGVSISEIAVAQFIGELEVIGEELFLLLDGDLWKADTTSDAAVPVLDTPGATVARNFEPLGDDILIAFDGDLWKVDTSGALSPLTQACPLVSGEVGPIPGCQSISLTGVGDGLLWMRDRYTGPVPLVDVLRRELWMSDGTASGTLLLLQLPYSVRENQLLLKTPELPLVDNAAYFPWRDDEHGVELWTSDATMEGTHLVQDIRPGPDSSAPGEFQVVDGTLYFVADDGTHGRELWRADPGGSVRMVRDIRPGPESSVPQGLAADGGVLYFAANDGKSGLEPWRSQGTAATTQLVVDVNPGPDHSSPGSFTRSGSSVYFSASRPRIGTELWQLRDALLGVAKRAGTTVYNGNGTFTVAIKITVKNHGIGTLTHLQVTDDLGANLPAGVSFHVKNLRASGELTVNTLYDGRTDVELLKGEDSLAPGETATILFDLTFDPGGIPGPYSNSASAWAEAPDGSLISDASGDGDDPDPDNNGDPTDNQEITEIVIPTSIPTAGTVGFLVLSFLLSVVGVWTLRSQLG